MSDEHEGAVGPELTAAFPYSPTLPVLFVGHGSPMNAIEDNEDSRAWLQVGARLPTPRAILCISAHWETDGPRVTAMPQPRTIYDFYGFPPALYKAEYPAPGSPLLARLVQSLLPGVTPDDAWGLDHGAWSVLLRLFPQATIPVVQLSLDTRRTPQQHYQFAAMLRPLRRRGVLIVASGNIVHNLRMICWEDQRYPWAVAFDAQVRDLIQNREHGPLIDYPSLSEFAPLAIPTNEHYLPLLYALALQEPDDAVRFFADRVTNCSLSMRSLQLGR